MIHLRRNVKSCAPDGTPRWLEWFPWVGLVVLCLVVFVCGLRATAGLRCPCEPDAYRDLGIAQSILDGTYPEDNAYRGETLWYNPLVGTIVAGVSRITGLNPPVVDIRLGAYLNLLVPLFFFLLCAALFDPWVALAALAFFLFGALPSLPYRVGAIVVTYVPWLVARNFTPFLFFATVLAYHKAWETDRRIWSVATGVLLGITFMSHTGPAILLGTIILFTTVLRLFRARKRGTPNKRLIADCTLIMILGFVCSLPYTYSILWNYHFRIVNDAPSQDIYPYFKLGNLRFVVRDALSWSTAIAYLGLIAVLFLRDRMSSKTLVLSWLGFACLFFSYSYYFVQILAERGVHLPCVVPGYQFGLYVSCAKALLFGYGVVVIARFLTDALRKARPFAEEAYARREHVLTVLLTIIVCALLYPQYRSGLELKIDAKPFAAYGPVYEWVIKNSTPDDVFLCDDSFSLYVVASANRKVVSSDPIFSNPYIDWNTRNADRSAMQKALQAKDAAAFTPLAAKYSVKFVIARLAEARAIEQWRPPFLEPVTSSGWFAVYRMRQR